MKPIEIKPGDTYLNLKLGQIHLVQNKNRTKDTSPNFIGYIRLAGWVNKAKEKEETVEKGEEEEFMKDF